MDPRHKSVGYTDDDLARPLVGVAHCWIELTPCNWNHQKLAEKVKEGIRAAGGTPVEFNAVSVTDGIAMGTEGMKASLVSGEVAPKPRYTWGVLAKYARLVSSPSEGAVTG